MTIPHRVLIEASEWTPQGSAPETAAVRLITLLPPSWTATIEQCTATTAVIAVTPTGQPTGQEIRRAVDMVLNNPALTGWRTRPS